MRANSDRTTTHAAVLQTAVSLCVPYPSNHTFQTCLTLGSSSRVRHVQFQVAACVGYQAAAALHHDAGRSDG